MCSKTDQDHQTATPDFYTQNKLADRLLRPSTPYHDTNIQETGRIHTAPLTCCTHPGYDRCSPKQGGPSKLDLATFLASHAEMARRRRILESLPSFRNAMTTNYRSPKKRNRFSAHLFRVWIKILLALQPVGCRLRHMFGATY